MPKVTMKLTDRDADNAEFVRQLTSARSKAHAISVALALTRFITERLKHGAELILRNQEGDLERVIMAELESIPRNSGSGDVVPHNRGT